MDPEHGFGIQFLDLGDEGQDLTDDEDEEEEGESTGGDVIMFNAFLKDRGKD